MFPKLKIPGCSHPVKAAYFFLTSLQSICDLHLHVSHAVDAIYFLYYSIHHPLFFRYVPTTKPCHPRCYIYYFCSVSHYYRTGGCSLSNTCPSHASLRLPNICLRKTHVLTLYVTNSKIQPLTTLVGSCWGILWFLIQKLAYHMMPLPTYLSAYFTNETAFIIFSAQSKSRFQPFQIFQFQEFFVTLHLHSSLSLSLSYLLLIENCNSSSNSVKIPFPLIFFHVLPELMRNETFH